MCGLLIAVTSHAMEHGRQGMGASEVAARGLRSCSCQAPQLGRTQAVELTCSTTEIWDLPRSGIKPLSPALTGGFFTLSQQGSPCILAFFRGGQSQHPLGGQGSNLQAIRQIFSKQNLHPWRTFFKDLKNNDPLALHLPVLLNASLASLMSLVILFALCVFVSLSKKLGVLQQVWLNNFFNYNSFCLKTMHILMLLLESQLSRSCLSQ